MKKLLVTVAVIAMLTESAAASARPAAWCGWYLRQVYGISDTSLNVARNWNKVGRPAGGPRVGAIVVWPHHVGKIVGRGSVKGKWIVHSGNDGHAVKTRLRSVASAIGFRMM